MATEESVPEAKSTGRGGTSARKPWYKNKQHTEKKHETRIGSTPDLEGSFFGSAGGDGLEEYKRTLERQQLCTEVRT